MEKDIKWLESCFDDEKSYPGGYVKYKIDQLDIAKNLSQELPVIPKHVAKHLELVKRSKTLMSLLTIAKRRTELPEWKKEYDWISENSETFARAWLDGYEVEEDQKYYALIKGHELLADHDALSFTYWNFNMSNGYLLHGNQFSKQSRFLTKMTKEEWFELGINDSNADFVKVEEID